jgi:putative transposase
LAEKLAVAEQFSDLGHSTHAVLSYCNLSSSSWYKSRKVKVEKDVGAANRGRPIPGYSVNPDGVLIPDQTIIHLLKGYRSRIEFQNAGGYYKLGHYLRRDYGFIINKKKVYRLCKENSLTLPRKKTKKWRQRKISVNRSVDAPNRLWQFDIKYGYIHGENKFFYVLVFVDVFTRSIVDFYVGKTCKSSDLSFTLNQALKKENIPLENGLVIRSDHGTQMTSNMFRKYLENLEIKPEHEFIPCGVPNKNAHVESFNSIFEIEFLQTRYFHSFADAYIQTCEFIEFYNKERIHGSLKYHTPHEARELIMRGQLTIKTVNI